MTRLLIGIVTAAAAAAILWTMFMTLETESVNRDEPPAIIMRAPRGFDVEELGATSWRSAAAALRSKPGLQAGVSFDNAGDEVILLADREGQRVVEMRASRRGTIVERSWPGEVDRRLAWAAENGDLDVPGLPPASGKNLYH